MLSPNLARIRSFDVVPSLPEPLDPLLELAHNLWWSWQPAAVQLFKRIDPELWRRSGHNPVQMLGSCPQNRLEQIATDDGFLTSMHRIATNLKIHIERTTWLASLRDNPGPCTIAYFCAEFGLTECLQIYSGGLGCLAGDHLKSASELGLPLVGIGLLYRHGYFQQYLNADGWQQEYYPDLDCANLPIKPVRDDDGRQIKVTIPLPDREVHVAIWKVRVGRIDLYLLDTNVPENGEEDRNITAHLYGGDMEMRIKQEIVLGVGGVRALAVAVRAHRGRGACVVVIARVQVGGERAPVFVTAIICAGVTVITRQRGTGRANARLAAVTDGTCVAIIAVREVGRDLAPGLGVTRVVGARVVVIAGEGGSDTHTLLTVVRLRARVVVEAFAFVERDMAAAFSAQTDVFGAGIVVVTGALVDVAVAVVVDPIAELGLRRVCVAGGEARVGAEPHTLADPVLIFLRAGGAEA